ncbi:MAG: DUF2693 domain-containing protein [Candidatus Marinimicrobia bacterium]|nr:DUF2693 domain-containing protein [Candidatus Neomarinimicrobiota bacterium]
MKQLKLTMSGTDMNDYRNLLKSNICEVTFTKVDGYTRVMTCTLQAEAIPEDKKPKGTSTRKMSDETIAVYDIITEDWRSFRIDSVTEFKVLK